MKIKLAKLVATSLAFAVTMTGFSGNVVAEGAQQINYVSVSDICEGDSGMLYMTDAESNVIWKGKDSDSKISVLAGKENANGNKNGSLTQTRLNGVWGIEKYNGGYVIADTENHVLRQIKGKKVTTFAGTGKAGKKDGKLKKAAFKRPTGLAVGDKGELYVADTGNSRVCVIDKKGNVKTYVGGTPGCSDGALKKAKLNEPTGLCYEKGVLYIADSGNHRVCKVQKGKLTTVAGSAKGVEGSKDGKVKASLLSYPQGVAVSKGVVYIADTGNASIRKVKSGKVQTLVKEYSLQEEMLPAGPRALYIKGKTLYVGDILAGQIFKVKL